MQRMIAVRRPGLGADLTSSVTSGVTDAVADAIMPKLKDFMVEEILPRFGLAVVIGLAAGAAIAAAIGAHFATRRNSGIRRNPSRSYSYRRRYAS